MTARRALVTGATGFIGSHLVRLLIRDDWAVHVIVRPSSDLGALGRDAAHVRTHIYDGTRASVAVAVAAAAPDLVFHLASRFLARHGPDDIPELLDSNVRFPTQLVEEMVAHGTYRLVNTGTVWQHFQKHAFSPVNLYSASKQAFETILQFYVEATPLRVLTLSLSDTYGPGDPRPKLFRLLCDAAGSAAPLAMSPGEQQLDLLFIDDVVEAFALAGEEMCAGTAVGHERFAVSSGQFVPLREVVATFEHVIGRTLPIEWAARPYRPREVMMPEPFHQVLPGWRPRIGLEEGIRRLLGIIGQSSPPRGAGGTDDGAGGIERGPKGEQLP